LTEDCQFNLAHGAETKNIEKIEKVAERQKSEMDAWQAEEQWGQNKSQW